MRILKSHPLLKMVNSYVIDSPTPSNISYLWNFGSLLGFCLVIQIITGVTLGMHYTPNVLEAFDSVEHIMRDVNNGWLIRYLHSNTASAFFFIVYLHIGRGLYYGSYKAPRTLVWTIGTVIFILMMATAFLGYVLPYGQMSLWGATVITNLMSAIPWVGQDIVESINITEYLIIINIVILLNVSIEKQVLPVIGTVSKKAHVNRKKRLSQLEYLSIPDSFIAFLIGIIDGDGYIQVTKTEKDYISIKLIISIHINDISVLNYIYSVLKLGIIKSFPNHKSPCCKLIINKTELQEVFFPLMLQNKIFFLTETRRTQFNKAMDIIVNNKKMYSTISNIPPVLFKLPDNPLGYINLPFFKNWIVGFTMSEGSFLKKKNNDACFQLKQRLHVKLFEAFKLVFNTERKISLDKYLYVQFGVSSKADIQTVINYFSFSGHHPLIGLKNIQYSTWLMALRNSSRYGNLIFPNSVR